MVQYFEVFSEGPACKHLFQWFFRLFGWLEGCYQRGIPFEAFFEKIEDHVAGHSVVAVVHRHFPEEILLVGIINDKGAEAVPHVVEGEESESRITGGLVFGLYEAAAQFNGLLPLVFDEGLGETEQLGTWSVRVAVPVQWDVPPEDETIGTDNLFVFCIPHQQLLERHFAGVVLINIHRHSRPATCSTEGELSQATDFQHHIGRIMRVNHIDVVVGGIGFPKKAIWGQFRFKYLTINRFNDVFHTIIL